MHQLNLREPWYECNKAAFEDQLRKEVPQGHVLHGLVVKIVARREDQDDFLFSLEDGRFAVVHLSWSDATTAGFPRTEIYETEEAVAHRIARDNEDWSADEGI
jgi:hypothetical protein